MSVDELAGPGPGSVSVANLALALRQLLRNRALDGMETLEGCHGSAMVRLLRLLEAPDPVGSERGAEIFGGASEAFHAAVAHLERQW